jgi:hypothetical protein
MARVSGHIAQKLRKNPLQSPEYPQEKIVQSVLAKPMGHH